MEWNRNRPLGLILDDAEEEEEEEDDKPMLNSNAMSLTSKFTQFHADPYEDAEKYKD
jgi:hypothetical protein